MFVYVTRQHAFVPRAFPAQVEARPCLLTSLTALMCAPFGRTPLSRVQIIQGGIHIHRCPRQCIDSLDVFVASTPPSNTPLLQVTKEDIEAEKARLAAIDARPIKKVAEAKARKQKRLQVGASLCGEGRGGEGTGVLLGVAAAFRDASAACAAFVSATCMLAACCNSWDLLRAGLSARQQHCKELACLDELSLYLCASLSTQFQLHPTHWLTVRPPVCVPTPAPPSPRPFLPVCLSPALSCRLGWMLRGPRPPPLLPRRTCPCPAR